MKLKDAISRNLSLKTEYGAGGRVGGGLFNRRVFRRRSYRLDGAAEDDVIHERQWKLGPVCVSHRSRNPSLFSGDPHEFGVSLFQVVGVYSNAQDFLIKGKAGLNMGLLRTALSLTPARVLAQTVDLDAATRAGFRLNVTRLARDIRHGDETDAEQAEFKDADLDFS